MKQIALGRPDLKLLHILLERWGFVISKININIAKSVQQVPKDWTMEKNKEYEKNTFLN